MKKLLQIFCFICISLQISAYEIPLFTNYAIDQTGTLTSNELQIINANLKTYQDSTINQIAILIIPNYDDQSGNGVLFDFSMAVFRKWKIGQEKKDNGVLLVIVKHLASKNGPGIRIVTGRGVEAALPDIICKRIIEKIRPSINRGDYYTGITTAIDEMTSALRGEYQAETNNDFSLSTFWIIVIIIIVIVIICLLIKHGSPSGGGFFDFDYSSSDSSGSFFDGGGGGDSGGGGAGD